MLSKSKLGLQLIRFVKIKQDLPTEEPLERSDHNLGLKDEKWETVDSAV